jgi:predicted TIM-barrel enzyme
MKRDAFHKLFKSPGPVVLPVIHVLDNSQAERNVRAAIGQGVAGVFLINHDFPYPQFLPVIRHVRRTFPSLWIGVNFLAVTGKDAFPVLGDLQREAIVVDAYWADDARIDERRSSGDQIEAMEIAEARTRSGWNGLYFGGTCFKKQREIAPEHYATSASLAPNFMDVVCTSGVATGKAADSGKIETFRSAIGEHALALASGITPDNAQHYAASVDCFMVATGINEEGDFYNIAPQKLARLMAVTREFGARS